MLFFLTLFSSFLNNFRSLIIVITFGKVKYSITYSNQISNTILDFIKNIGLIFTLTNGFKDLNGLVKGKVNLELKKNIRELEHKLNNTSRTIDGNLKFTSGVSDDAESAILKGWSIDV